jgi:HEPN domain-containing protein
MLQETTMDIGDIVRYWLNTAIDDLAAAEHLCESGDYIHALFFGHLYLEKLLKARVVQQIRQHAPLSHNLRYLAEKGKLDLNREQEAFLLRVTEYSIKARYPDMDLKFRRQCTREFCCTELAEIEEFGVWVRQTVRF